MLGVRSSKEPMKGKFANDFLKEVVKMSARNHKKTVASSKPKYKSGYVLNWK